MSSALSTAISGLTSSVARATQSASNIVNASSTGKNNGGNLAGDLVNLNTDSTNFAANASVIKTVEKMDKSLLDITV